MDAAGARLAGDYAGFYLLLTMADYLSAMAMEFEHQSWRQEPVSGAKAGQSRRPDWRILRLRLLAAYEAQRSFEEAEVTGGRVDHGSFHAAVARHLAALGECEKRPTESER